MPSAPYPLSALRALALHAQELATPLGLEPAATPERIVEIVSRLGCVQIDTLQMVQRSQYLVLWSRLGAYNPVDFDRLIYDSANQRLFEGWLHAACIVPLDEYRYQMPHQRWLRELPAERSSAWLAEPGSIDLLQSVRERIRREGQLRAADFEYNGPRRGSWWDWKPAKNALEHLYAWGELMIADRVNFQRVYDLTERILPEWVDTCEPTRAARDEHWIEQGVSALGVCTPSQAAGYSYRKLSAAKPILERLLAEGVLVSVKGQLADGKVSALLVHRDNLPWLEKAAAGGIIPQRTTFLSPFDSLFWAKGRDGHLWGFRQSLEAYLPAAKRIWGYFCLPILHHDRLVGRFDPKLDRREETLRLKAIYLEPGIAPEEELVSEVAAAMRDFLAFHAANNLVIERSQPAEFGEKLMAAL